MPGLIDMMHQSYAYQNTCVDNGFAHVQVLKKHPPSQAVDETLWETFVTRYLNSFHWKSRLVPGLVDIMHQAHAS